MPLQGTPPIGDGTLANSYFLDTEDRIVSVTGNWDDFAINNGGEDLLAESIKGQSIWDFITGDPTRMWFDVLLQKAKLRKEAVERPYRCDSPDLKRFMKMRIYYEQDHLVIENYLLGTEVKDKPSYITGLTNNAQLNRLNTHFRCSACGRIRFSGYWQEPGDIPQSDQLRLHVTYVICDDCEHEQTG